MFSWFKNKKKSFKEKAQSMHQEAAPRFLFLDFDGVIFVPNRKSEPLVENVNRLCEQFDLKVVISSSWRTTMEIALNALKEAGFRGEVVGRTEVLGQQRYEEILQYLSCHPWSNYLILDDMEMYCLSEQAVKTDFFEGFHQKKLEEACGKCRKW